jgi:argininosuccinate lyase
MIPGIKTQARDHAQVKLRGFSNRHTDLADYLVRRGLPFRDCHEIVGHAGIRYRQRQG